MISIASSVTVVIVMAIGLVLFAPFARPHGAVNGRTPYEALRDKL